jgi:hypothetical protein
MARMKPPIVPEQPVPVVPGDGLRQLLVVCAGKDFEARRDTAIITPLLDTGALASSQPARRCWCWSSWRSWSVARSGCWVASLTAVSRVAVAGCWAAAAGQACRRAEAVGWRGG